MKTKQWRVIEDTRRQCLKMSHVYLFQFHNSLRYFNQTSNTNKMTGIHRYSFYFLFDKLQAAVLTCPHTKNIQTLYKPHILK